MIYICSDLHGQYDLYLKMLKDIKFSGYDELYVLGDVIDRGPQSIEILQDMISRDNVYYIVGNHELMMYAHHISDRDNDYWLNSNNGGRVTNKQLLSLSQTNREQIEHYMFNCTYLQVELESPKGQKFLLSHSYFLENQGTISDWKPYYNDPMYYANDALRAVWYSPWRSGEYAPKSKYNDGRIHIVGHVPVHCAREDDNLMARWDNKPAPHIVTNKLEAYVTNNIINLDGGCARIGKKDGNTYGLICMNLTAYVEGNPAFTYYTN